MDACSSGEKGSGYDTIHSFSGYPTFIGRDAGATGIGSREKTGKAVNTCIEIATPFGFHPLP
jgi:hypothetical protein